MKLILVKIDFKIIWFIFECFIINQVKNKIQYKILDSI